ncbi:MAG TPA: FUSC family protein [Steroidobacteraceae bacterium]|nr:FUSC family protein [Steroidobacteraceae bacterium]
MPASRSHAPADHFNPARAQVSDLNASVANLRSALPLLSRVAAGAHYGMISACAALLAYLPAHAIGLKESFWSAITAISVSQTEFRAAQTTARDQFVGAAVGGLTGLCMFLALGENVFVYALAVLVAMLVCSVLNVGSASRLAGITATIILLVPRVGSPTAMFLARLSEVGWGLCVAVTVVWLAGRLPAATSNGRNPGLTGKRTPPRRSRADGR